MTFGRTVEITPEEKALRDAESKLRQAESANDSLRSILQSLFDFLDGFVMFLRFVLYVGSVAGAWFYLHERALAVAIAVSITLVHALAYAREQIAIKKAKLRELK